ncbi:hypothetical protein [Komagataeibacter medellinensis]|uniref:hypothetical protein n=1 Tax=Komagataeibacter medellinensis TaxID=1177712 RepID=UPI00225E297C|nr:hypothetical protein [Komagataeibacter medellinensis]
MLVAWEAEALLATREIGPDQFDMIVPPVTILAETARGRGGPHCKSPWHDELAQAYVEYLFSDAGQKTGAKHYFRPRRSRHSCAEPGALCRHFHL